MSISVSLPQSPPLPVPVVCAGVFEKCAELYDCLDVKQIQIDTVG